MLARIKSAALVLSTLSLFACNSSHEANSTTYNLNTLANQGDANVTVNLNDKVIINQTEDSSQWWVLQPDKKSINQLTFDFHSNKRQHTLTFVEPGEFGVTSIQKAPAGQMAQFSRTMTFVVRSK